MVFGCFCGELVVEEDALFCGELMDDDKEGLVDGDGLVTDAGALEYSVTEGVGGKRPLDDEKLWKVFDKEVLLSITPFGGGLMGVEVIPWVDRILLANSLRASKKHYSLFSALKR